jgi:hypothetical protein
MKMKLTAVEKRAKAFCEVIKAQESGSIAVEWKKSAMYGFNPVIYNYAGEKVTNVSGCGYCKHSTALADCLQFLGKTEEERKSIARTGGCGVPVTIAALAAIGWQLSLTHSGKSFDCYTLHQLGKI